MSSGKVSRYNIHGFCTFDILDNSGYMSEATVDVQQRYQYFKTDYDPALPPDMRVVIEGFEPNVEGCTVLDDSYWIKKGYLYFSGERYKMGARWSFDVSGLDGGVIELRIAANLLGRPFIAGRIISFFIYYLLQRQGCSLLHASAAARDGEAFLFAARGGGGKTTLALAAAFSKDMNFMGDNFVILKDGLIYSYLSDLNMFGYNLHPRVWRSLTKFERIRFRMFAVIHRLTFGYIKIFSSVSPLRFLEGSLCDSAPLKRLSLMKTWKEYSVNSLTREDLIASMTSNMKLEFFSFVRHTAAYACRFPESTMASLWEAYSDQLVTNLPVDVLLQLITVPEQITDEIKAKALAASIEESAA